MIDRLALWWTAPSLVVETAGPDDCPALATVHATGFRHDWSADELADLMRQPGVVAYRARRANFLGQRSVVGFVMVRKAAGEAEVLTMAVDPAHRRQGIGRRLLEHALRGLYADRVGEVFLEVDAGNAAAVALYRRLGFAQVGIRRGYYAASPNNGDGGGDGTALVMRADLG